MAEKKITKREMFERIMGKLTDESEKAFIAHELELLAKKNSADKKPTATQKENVGLKEEIIAKMTEIGGQMTVTEIQKAMDTELSNQRVSALIRQLVVDGKVVRTEDKRKAYFSIAE